MTLGLLPLTSANIGTQPTKTSSDQTNSSGSSGDTTTQSTSGETTQPQTSGTSTAATTEPARSSGVEQPSRTNSEALVIALSSESSTQKSAVIDNKVDPAFLTEDVAREMAVKLQRSIEDSLILQTILAKSLSKGGAEEVEASGASDQTATADPRPSSYDVIRSERPS